MLSESRSGSGTALTTVGVLALNFATGLAGILVDSCAGRSGGIAAMAGAGSFIIRKGTSDSVEAA